MSRNVTADPVERFLSGIGLAARAGRLRIGPDAVGSSIREGRAAAIVIAGDAPGRVRSRLQGLLNSRPVPCKIVLDGEALGRAIGRPRVVALAVTDVSLGRRVVELASGLESC